MQCFKRILIINAEISIIRFRFLLESQCLSLYSYFYPQNKPSHCCSLNLMIFIVSPKHAQRSCAKSNSGSTGSSAYTHWPQKHFAQHRLRKLNPPSSNIVKYSFSLQPIMNNSFILQPIIFNPKFSSNQRKSPKKVRKLNLSIGSSPIRWSPWWRSGAGWTVRASANRFCI